MDNRIIYVCDEYDKYEFKSKRIWRTDGKYEPFVYIIQEIETEMMYIGSRTKFVGKSCLESDLGTIYFTSSKRFDWRSNPSSFVICKIIPCASNHDAIILESILIDQNYAVYDKNYYNKHNKGTCFSSSSMLSEETKRKISASRKGRPGTAHSKEHILKMSELHKGENNPFYGRKHSDKTKEKWKRSRTCENHPMHGRKHSKETKEHWSKIRKGRPAHNKGSTHSDKTKQRLSEVAKNRPKFECPHCHKTMTKGNLTRWHGDNCKYRVV